LSRSRRPSSSDDGVRATKQCKHFARSSPDERHQLRIALKKLRYTIELLESLLETTSVKALMKRLKGLQEDLGHLNDVGTAQRLITELARPAEHDIDDVGFAGGFARPLAGCFVFRVGFASPIIAVFTQTMAGNPSTILFQLFPSSVEPYKLPLRVPK